VTDYGGGMAHTGLSVRRSVGGLDELLVEARQHSAEFPDVLANHVPMVLAALERLGFRRDRLATVPRSTSANPAKLEDAAPMAEWLVDGGLTTPPHPAPEL